MGRGPQSGHCSNQSSSAAGSRMGTLWAPGLRFSSAGLGPTSSRPTLVSTLGRSNAASMADSYSFDVVSDFDRQELVNTVDQVRRDVSQRYDLKDSNTEIELEETAIVITTASDMTLDAVVDVLRQKATKRSLSLKIFDEQTPESVGGNRIKQEIKLRKGLSQELAKKLSKTVRDQLKKVTVSIQGESLRVTGKNKDELQNAIQLLKEQDIEVPLQFQNYR